MPDPVTILVYNPYAQAMFVLGIMIIIVAYIYNKKQRTDKPFTTVGLGIEQGIAKGLRGELYRRA